MIQSLSTEVRMIKGVGPQRAELLAQRGIYSLEDLLGYLPFRYEDRIHFSNVKDIQPNGVYTIRARVMSGQAVRTMRGREQGSHVEWRCPLDRRLHTRRRRASPRHRHEHGGRHDSDCTLHHDSVHLAHHG